MEVFHLPDRNYDLTIYCDGSSFQGPPHSDGTGGLGFIIYDRYGHPLHQRSQVVEDANNNEAELRAIIEALRTAAGITRGRVKVYTDSSTARQLIEHTIRPFTPEIRGLVAEADRLRTHFVKVAIKQIPRRFNGIADYLSRLTVTLFRKPGRASRRRRFWQWNR